MSILIIKKRDIDGACIRTPTTNTFAKFYQRFTGENMMKANGVHPTVTGRKWFAWALQIWARESGAHLVLCVGWNAGSQCKAWLKTPQINEEYDRQRIMVNEIREGRRTTPTTFTTQKLAHNKIRHCSRSTLSRLD